MSSRIPLSRQVLSAAKPPLLPTGRQCIDIPRVFSIRRARRPLMNVASPARVIRCAIVTALLYCALHALLPGGQRAHASAATLAIACVLLLDWARRPRCVRIRGTPKELVIETVAPLRTRSFSFHRTELRSIRLRDTALLPRQCYAAVEMTTVDGNRAVLCRDWRLPEALSIFHGLSETGAFSECHLQLRMAQPYRGPRMAFDGRSAVPTRIRLGILAIWAGCLAWLVGWTVGAIVFPFDVRGIAVALFMGAVAGWIHYMVWTGTWWVCVGPKPEQLVEVSSDGVRIVSPGALVGRGSTLFQWPDIVAVQVAAVDEAVLPEFYRRELVMWLRNGRLLRVMRGASHDQIDACCNAISGGPVS